MYFMHFLEGARFLKAPVLAGHKVLYAPHCQLTVRWAASPPTSVFGQNSAVSADCQVDRVPPLIAGGEGQVCFAHVMICPGCFVHFSVSKGHK